MSAGCFNVSQQSDGKLVIVGNDQVGDVSLRHVRTPAADGGAGLHASATAASSTSAISTRRRALHSRPAAISSPASRSRIRRTAYRSRTSSSSPARSPVRGSRRPSRSARSPTGRLATFFTRVRDGELGIGGVVHGERSLLGRGQFRAAHRRRQLHDHREPGRQRHVLRGDAQSRARSQVTQASQAITFAPAPTGVTVGQPLVMISATSGELDARRRRFRSCSRR